MGMSDIQQQFVNHPLLRTDTVRKRDYQVNIFASCAKSNCLVVIPTGLGKTIIALLLSIHQLKDPNAKIIFLAPTRPLVEQHFQTFKNLTQLEDKNLIMMTGAVSPQNRGLLYQDPALKCLFMTPQILQNDIISGIAIFDHVSLMIFDEAHRAVGDYAYTFLANKYYLENSNRKILAMTASPGKNREKIQEVMKNLHLNMIEIRTERDPDVKPYIQDVETEWIDVELPVEMQEILDSLEGIQKKIFKELHTNQLLDSVDSSKISRKTLLKAGKELDRRIAQNKDSNNFALLLYCKKLLANAIRISHMQELIEAQGINAFKDYLDKNFKKVEDGKGGKSLQELFSSHILEQIYSKTKELLDGDVNHPKVAILLSKLTEQMVNVPESRILIFCHFRDTVNFLVKEVNKSNKIRASKFVGQQKRGKEKGLSQKEQLQILQDFKTGVFNTLIATSVAEEGLDISECDMVIFFDVVPSEIRAIQRRGRTGRNAAGKVIILKTTGTREEGYYWAERHRERQMKKVLQSLKEDMMKMTNKGMQANDKKNSKNNLLNYMKKPKKPQDQNIMSNLEDSDATDENSPNLPLKSDDGESNSEKEPDLTIDFGQKFSNSTDSANPYVLVDSRETASSVTRSLSELNANIELHPLPTGDYVVSSRCGIERKSINDFIDSVKDGRLFDELIRLRNQFSHPILILEGDYHSIISLKRAAVLGSLTSIILKLNVFLIQTRDAQDTADMIFALAKKEQKSSPHPISIRFQKIPEQLDKQLEHIVAGIPGINTSRAQDLLSEFRTLKNLFSASPEEIEKVRNIGTVIAQKIHKYANLDYLLKDDEENG